MSIERAVKFCNSCFDYSTAAHKAFGNETEFINYALNGAQSCTARNIFLKTRDDATKEAMLALEESLTKGPREPTAFENKPEGSVEQVRVALDACMNCDYNKPSIVNVFIIKSQDKK